MPKREDCVAPLQDRIVCAVMAGGSGTRIWPLSRKAEPKQLLQFFGDKTLLRVTVDRIAALCPPERRLCVTAGHLRDAVQSVLPELGPGQILAEPLPRNTAPAMALAAIVAEQMAPGAILVLLPSDHYVADAAAFREAILRAAVHADRGVKSRFRAAHGAGCVFGGGSAACERQRRRGGHSL